jgi:AraC-like DNA-binding protein
VLLSHSYPPSDALAPYVTRFYVFDADLPLDTVIHDGLLAETAFVRIIKRGEWAAETEAGQWVSAGPAILFGANDRPFQVRVKGAFTIYGFAIRPSGWKSLIDQPHSKLLNKMYPLSDFWGGIADAMLSEMENAKTDQDVVAAMENAVAAQLKHVGRYKNDPLMADFEKIAGADSVARIHDVAHDMDLSVRQMERRCRDTFGLSPKAVLRRSRFLDMAAAMRGFSSPSEAELAALRYFDQSHLNREFRRFTGMTPGAFAKAFTPLLTAGLKLREEGKDLIRK